MSWTALVPLKAVGARKSRLAGRLDLPARDALAAAMFDHVAGVLATCPGIARTVVLAERPPAGWRGAWLADGGRGLNAELATARDLLAAERLVVLHADLPWLDARDLAALLVAAEQAGCAIAPDCHGTGTNALAATDLQSFAFAFGAASFARHRAALPHAAIVDRRGLACDLDTPDDLDAAGLFLERLHAA